ncbi:hypothetical protein [Marinobacter mobilis]|uniref:Uncharacterized protein n=1 Tax=Marinobacter mobilis TaxID=488533 RepID=A0A1H2PXB6_9GAMM|nr:hypothetical protein [Marinobacter mobilis]SDV99506.1 hypothetical protein SAMN04487960_1011 [Marinobacter mobilis]
MSTPAPLLDYTSTAFLSEGWMGAIMVEGPEGRLLRVSTGFSDAERASLSA